MRQNMQFTTHILYSHTKLIPMDIRIGIYESAGMIEIEMSREWKIVERFLSCMCFVNTIKRYINNNSGTGGDLDTEDRDIIVVNITETAFATQSPNAYIHQNLGFVRIRNFFGLLFTLQRQLCPGCRRRGMWIAGVDNICEIRLRGKSDWAMRTCELSIIQCLGSMIKEKERELCFSRKRDKIEFWK